MANEPEKWDPSKPLLEKDDEADCQREAQARARVKYLQTEYEKSHTPAPTPKKRKGLFRNSD